MILKLRDRIERGMGDDLVDPDNVLDPKTNNQYLKMLEDEKRKFSVDVSVYVDLDSCGVGFIEMIYGQLQEEPENEKEKEEDDENDLSLVKTKIHSIFEALNFGPYGSHENLYASPEYIMKLKKATNCRLILMTSDYFMAQKYSQLLDETENPIPKNTNNFRPEPFQSHLKQTIQVFNNREVLIKFVIRSARFSQGVILSNDAVFASISNILWAPMIYQNKIDLKNDDDDNDDASTLNIFDGGQLFKDDQEKLLYFPILWEYFDYQQMVHEQNKDDVISEDMNYQKIIKGSKFLDHVRTSGTEKIMESCLKNIGSDSVVKEEFLKYLEQFTDRILRLEELVKFESFIEERTCQGLSLDKYLLYDEDFVPKILNW